MPRWLSDRSTRSVGPRSRPHRLTNSADSIYESSQLHAVHAAAIFYAGNEPKQLDGLEQAGNVRGIHEPSAIRARDESKRVRPIHES